MFIVYVLYSKKYNKIYIGYTSNMEQRLLSHNELAIKGHTVKYRPWMVAFTEEYKTKKNAMLRENQLKAGKGREWIWQQLKDLGLISA